MSINTPHPATAALDAAHEQVQTTIAELANHMTLLFAEQRKTFELCAMLQEQNRQLAERLSKHEN